MYLYNNLDNNITYDGFIYLINNLKYITKLKTLNIFRIILL